MISHLKKLSIARLYLIKIIISFGYVGYIRGFPGTLASLLVCIVYDVWDIGHIWSITTLSIWLFLFIIVTKIVHRHVSNLTEQDPSFIVIDEVFGQLLPLFLCDNSYDILVSFVMFRVFDILKPWPIYIIESRLKGGVAVMLDDVLAGVMAIVVLSVYDKMLILP